MRSYNIILCDVALQLVLQAIGHPPEEVNAAYLSPDQKIVDDMKKTLMQYQNFLFNFEVPFSYFSVPFFCLLFFCLLIAAFGSKDRLTLQEVCLFAVE